MFCQKRPAFFFLQQVEETKLKTSDEDSVLECTTDVIFTYNHQGQLVGLAVVYTM